MAFVSNVCMYVTVVPHRKHFHISERTMDHLISVMPHFKAAVFDV